MNTSPHLSRKTLHLRRLNHLVSAELPASNTDAQEINFNYANESQIKCIEIRYRGNRDVNPVTKSVGVDMRKKCFSSASMRPF